MPADTTPDALVVGAGVIGCSIALDLARRGYAVTVVDKGLAPGAGSTSSSSAIVRFHYSTRDGVAAAWEAMHCWRSWPEHLRATDEDGLARFHRLGMVCIDPPTNRREVVFEHFDAVGVPYELLSSEALHRRFPALDVGRFWPPRRVDDDDFAGPPDGDLDAYFTPDAGFVDDPQLAARNLMVAATAEGARFRFRSAVTAIRSRGGRVVGVELADASRLDAGVVVNAAGPHSSRVNALAGVLDDFGISTRPLRQEVHVAPAPTSFTYQSGGTMVSDPDLGTYFRPHLGGTLLVGSVEPECDPLVWVDDPDVYDVHPTVPVWQAQVLRLARRVPDLGVPHRPAGLAALYDVTDDWIPIYDRTNLDGFYVAIGTSGNQFKNAPVVGRFMAELIEACENGHDHDADPVQVVGHHTGAAVNLGHYSRKRPATTTTMSVLG